MLGENDTTGSFAKASFARQGSRFSFLKAYRLADFASDNPSIILFPHQYVTP